MQSDKELLVELMIKASVIPINAEGRAGIEMIADFFEKTGLLDQTYLCLVMGESLVKYSTLKNEEVGKLVESLGLPTFKFPPDREQRDPEWDR